MSYGFAQILSRYGHGFRCDHSPIMIDAPYDPEAESTYECLECGDTVSSKLNPGTCPNCNVAYRNTAMPIE